jgi:prephenate dehydratase
MNLLPQHARVAFQGEPGAFSEEAAIKLLGEDITTLPRTTFDAAFHALSSAEAEAVLAPIENSLAGSVLRVYDLLVESGFWITAEIILPIEHHLIACPGATLAGIRSVESHPMALAQCERLIAAHPEWKRVAAEDTAGSARDVIAAGDPSRAAIAGRRASDRYRGLILISDVQDNRENFTRFVLLVPAPCTVPGADKMTLVMRLPHRPGALLAALDPFARHEVNLLKIESRPIHGRPWEYQFFVDLAAADSESLENALRDLRHVAQEVRVLGLYGGAGKPSHEKGD